MKAQKWQFSNIYVYQPGIAEWMKKYPHLAMFHGQPLSANQAELKKIQQEYRKHLVSTKEFVRLSHHRNYIVFDVRSLSLRDNFPVTLPNLKHYPVDRLVKLIESGSRKVTRKDLLILDNCGKQTLWLQYILHKAGLNKYSFLKKGILSWQQEGYDRFGRANHGIKSQ